MTDLIKAHLKITDPDDKEIGGIVISINKENKKLSDDTLESINSYIHGCVTQYYLQKEPSLK